MYNGVGMGSTRGTGLSGYIQRSRVVAQRSLALNEPVDGAEPEGRDATTALEKARSKNENNSLAAALEEHDKLRAIRLRIILYGEERQREGIQHDQIDRECAELNAALLRQYVQEKQSKLTAATAAKTQVQFAEAFGVQKGEEGTAFDRVRQAAAEKERRLTLAKSLDERGKKARVE